MDLNKCKKIFECVVLLRTCRLVYIWNIGVAMTSWGMAVTSWGVANMQIRHCDIKGGVAMMSYPGKPHPYDVILFLIIIN